MSSALVQVKEDQQQLRKLLESARGTLAHVLPAGLKPERMVSMVLSAFARDNRLAECGATTIGRASIVQAVVRAAELGLELNTPLGEAWLAPYWDGRNKCKLAQLLVGYRGFVKLAYQSPRVLAIASDVVRAADRFEVTRGTAHPYLIHVADPKASVESRGDIVAAYMTVRLAPADGDVYVYETMPLDELMRIRNSSDGWKAYEAKKIQSTPWAEHFSEMCRKTVIRRGVKLLPLSDGIRRALAVDEAPYEPDEVVVAPSRGESIKAAIDIDPSPPEGSPVTGGDV